MRFPLIWGFILSGIFFLDLLLQFYTRKVGWGSANNGFSFGFGDSVVPAFGYLILVGSLFFFVVLRGITGPGWWLVITGGLANAIARLVTGSVWDYLHWQIVFSLWFNLADISITLGVIWQIWNYRSSGKTKT